MHPEDLLELEILFVFEKVILDEIVVFYALFIVELMFEDILYHGGKFEKVEIPKKLAIPNLVNLILKPNILNNRNNIILVNNKHDLPLIQILIQQNTHQLFLVLNLDQKTK